LRLPALGWIFVLFLSAAPVLVGAAEGTMREFPEKELVSDQPFSLLADAILPSVVGPALLVGVVGYCSMLIANSERFDEAAPNSRTVVVGSLVLLTVAVLWLAVVWVHWNVTMVQRIGFRDMRPIALSLYRSADNGRWLPRTSQCRRRQGEPCARDSDPPLNPHP
jgi:hypothetical protein